MSSPQTFEDTLAGKPDFVRAVAKQLRKLVQEEFSEIDVRVYGGEVVQAVVYLISGTDKMLCGIQPGKDDVLFYIHNVTEADSEVLKLGGKGKSSRHVKLTELDGDTETELRRLLQLAKSRTEPI